ncbi:adenylate kinase [Trypanosoma brucei equiperdum]|uniref:Adenylate kinase n=1 Tax=Trypanosoma brucei equiperdum TaxID=630700 RepID=A0A3L6L5Z9_9TRYP|nr:adenylate kinase [Trypanosoma brucei equiperdum]
MKVIFLGPPGCGKGTQSPFVAKRYDICHLSTGDMLREAVEKKTEYGLKAKSVMDVGGLVSDDIVFGIVKESIKQPRCKNGYLLDGYPRTLRQAEMMEEAGEKVNKVIHFDAPDDVIISRVSGRWLHRASGRIYHEVFCPPKVRGLDDVTSEPLIQRPDDRKEVVEKRLVGYHRQTKPLIDYYRARGVLATLDATQSVNVVRESLRCVLDPVARLIGAKIYGN